MMISIHVDDNFCIGHKPTLTELIQDLKKHGLLVKVTEDMTNDLSCNIVFLQDGKSMRIRQPHLIWKLEEKLRAVVKDFQTYATPRTPGLHIGQPAIVTTEMMARMPLYQSAVGTLLFLLKFSWSDLANPIKELSKVLDFPMEVMFKELKRVIQFVLDTRDYGMKIKPIIDDTDDAWNVAVSLQ